MERSVTETSEERTRRRCGGQSANPRLIERALDGKPVSGNVRVDLGRADIIVSEQLLNGSDVVVVFEQVRRKAVPECMTPGVLVDARPLNCPFYGLLYRARRSVMPAPTPIVAATFRSTARWVR